MSDIQQTVRPPIVRRLWLVILLTCLLISFPVSLIILLTGDVYRWRDNGWRPIGKGSRYTYAGILLLWLVAAVARVLLQPGGLHQELADNAVHDTTSNTQPSPAARSARDENADNHSNNESPAKPTASKTPDMNISIGGEYNDITITADDDVPFSIERIVLNDREGEKNCDFGPITITDEMTVEEKLMANLRTKLPTKDLHRGDSVQFGSSCGETLRVSVYTNHGVSQYRMK